VPPFRHAPQLPVGPPPAPPLVLLVAVALALAAGGLAGLRGATSVKSLAYRATVNA
jgi:putative exporter of polyketide antibiotics